VAKAPKRDPKREALAKDGALNPHPEAVHDALFTGNPFFDAEDLVQVRYEMVRRHGVAISEVSTNFGVSRPTFYKALRALQKDGLPGLLPSQRGPKDGHKISAEVLAFVVDLKNARPKLTSSQCLKEIETRFGIKIHRRSLERALARKKNESIWANQRSHIKSSRRVRVTAYFRAMCRAGHLSGCTGGITVDRAGGACRDRR
jgi:transposase